MMKIDNKEKITELVGNIGKDNGFISFDKVTRMSWRKRRSKTPYSMAHISLTHQKI